MAKAKNDTVNNTVESDKILFFCYYGKQYTNADLVFKTGKPKLNPAIGKTELDDNDIQYIHFDNGICAIDKNDEERIDFLDKYNSGGELLDGRILKPTPFPTISRTEIDKAETVTVEKIVEVTKNIIPISILEALDEAVLIDMAKNSLGYEVKSESKKDILKELKENGFTI